MALRERIYEMLKTHGPMTDEALGEKLGAPIASVRRSRQELVRNDKVRPYRLQHRAPHRGLKTWGEAQDVERRIRETPNATA